MDIDATKIPKGEKPAPLIEYKGQTYILDKANEAAIKFQDAGIRAAHETAGRAWHMAFAALMISIVALVLTALR